MIALWVLVGLASLWGWPSIWAYSVKHQVELTIKFNRSLVAIGDEIEVSCQVVNQSFLPLPRLRLVIPLPQGLLAETEKPFLILETSVGGRESITAIGQIRATRRGPKVFDNPVELVVYDWLGLRDMKVQQDIHHQLAVMPDIQPQAMSSLPLKSLIGSFEVRRWLHVDESLYRGARPYHPGDPFKHIDWLASATSGNWLVKEFSTSSESTLHLMMNAQSQQDYWTGLDEDLFDEICSKVASVAQLLEKRRFVLHFWTNAVWTRSVGKLYFGRQSATGIRTLLAEAKPLVSVSQSDLLEMFLKSRHREDAILFTSYLSGEDAQTLEKRFNQMMVVPIGCGGFPESTQLHHLETWPRDTREVGGGASWRPIGSQPVHT